MSSPVLACQDVCKRFGGVSAVADVSVRFNPGQVTALIGPNGAGKTTLFHLIGGALRTDGGRIELRGQRIDGLPAWRVARLGVGRLFQDVRLFGRLSVVENIRIAFHPQLGENPLWALLARPRVSREEARLAQLATELLAEFGLEAFASRPAEALSGGQQKLVAVARLLASGADVLLLDEPTAGVHAEPTRQLMATMRRAAQDGKTVVFIEHNLSAVRAWADWVVLMHRGRVLAQGRPADVLGGPDAARAYLRGAENDE